jgi:hypothetical protein
MKRSLPILDREAPPLFVIPYRSDAAFVWSPLAESGTVTALHVGDAAVTILERKKLFRPGVRLEVCLVGGAALRDGVACTLEVTTASGDVEIVQTTARLARWTDPDTRAVLKLVASRPAQAEPRQILERYLTFTSAWQAPTRLEAVFPDGCIAAIDLNEPQTALTAYAITSQGFEAVTVQPLVQRAGTLLLWIGQPDLQHLYFEISGALVQARLSAIGAAYPGPALPSLDAIGSDLAEALHAAVESPSAELAAWVAGLCQPQVSISTEHATITVRRIVHLPTNDVAALIDVSGAADDVHSFYMTAFGSPDVENLDVIACDIGDENVPVQQKIIVRTVQAEPFAGCYRLSWTCAGDESAVWIRASHEDAPGLGSLARDFLPVAQVRADVFPSVLHPLATVPNHDVPPGIVEVIEWGLSENAAADLFIFAGNDLEALHRTLLAFSLTSGEIPLNIHLCVFDRRIMNSLRTAVRDWVGRYDLSLGITCHSPRTSEAQVARHVFHGERPRLFCRAGAVPGRSNWLEAVFASLEQGRATLTLGTCDPRTKASADTLMADLSASESEGGWLSQITAGAAPADTVPDLTRLPRFYTFEAFLLAQALRETRDATALSIAADVHFVQSGTTSTTDAFGARLDAYSLQKLVQSSSAGVRRWRVVRGRTTG